MKIKAPLPKKEDIKNFPFENTKARIARNGLHVYVIENYVRAISESGEKLYSHKILGKVIDGVYYQIEEYHRLFKRNGQKRVDANVTKSNRTYVRRKSSKDIVRAKPKYSTQLPDSLTVKNYPHDIEGARIIKIGKVFYVVTTRYFRADGKNQHVYTYYGRVVDGEFFTTEQYKKLFNRYGQRRDVIEA